MTKFVALTGDRPTGPLHLGHYVGSLANRVSLQHTHEQYIMVADVQALTDNFDNPQKIADNICEVVRDYLAVGIDPDLSNIFLQSKIPAIAEMTIYFLNLVSIGRLERNPTVKNEIAQKGFGDSIPAGFFCYPVSQAADITAFLSDVVPVGEDQIPMIEQTNEIVRKFNRIYNTDCLREAKAFLSNNKRLSGIDGKAKASKSLGNAIFLSEDKASLKKKVYSMYTDPLHIKISDPGSIEGNVVFEYLEAFLTDKEELLAMQTHYQRGGLGDTTIKERLYQVLNAFLEPIREKRASYHNDDIKQVIYNGTVVANKKAANTLLNVRSAMGLL